jgi:hypothetical protein
MLTIQKVGNDLVIRSGDVSLTVPVKAAGELAERIRLVADVGGIESIDPERRQGPRKPLNLSPGAMLKFIKTGPVEPPSARWLG